MGIKPISFSALYSSRTTFILKSLYPHVNSLNIPKLSFLLRHSAPVGMFYPAEQCSVRLIDCLLLLA